MLQNKQKKVALVHIAQSAVRMDRDAYQKLLWDHAGITSASALSSEAQFAAIMTAFKERGFVGVQRARSVRVPDPTAWGCLPAQRAKIEYMWQQRARTPTPEALHTFVATVARVSPRKLTPPLASRVIVVLTKMPIVRGDDARA